MNILFATAHPAQIHNFRLLKNELENNGHKTYWIATEKDISKYLLQKYNIDYFLLKKPGKSFFNKAYSLLVNTYRSIIFIRKNNVDIIISRVSPYLSLAGFLLRKKHFALADTESSGIYNTVFAMFLSKLITAESFQKQIRQDQVRFSGNIELFYLHPNRFKPLPKEKVANLLNINPSEPYVIMRFVSWDAYHDKGLSGFTDDNKLKAVKEFSRFAKVLISSEKELPEALQPYQIKIPPERMHDALAHATLFFGESATMASESAVLGTPAIYLNENWLGYTDEAEKFGLLHSFKQDAASQEKAIAKALKLLQTPNLKESVSKNHQSFLKDKIDPTAFMVWFIENYPQSAKIMKENPDYQYRFK